MQIMVVDDDAVSRHALVDIVQKIGFIDVLEFPDGQAAWEYLLVNPLPILCCCDVRMPKLSGIELLEKVRSNTETEPLNFALITSGTDRDIVQKAIMLGVLGYIVKPFIAGEASAKLEEALVKDWKSIAEDPGQTARRLSVSREKLQDYFNGYKAQVDQLIGTLSEYDTTANDMDLTTQLDAMKKGCLTLGLWQCANQLERLESKDERAEMIVPFLLNINAALAYQCERLKAETARSSLPA